MDNGAPIVALVRDLILGARVRGSAADAVVVQTPSALRESVGPATRLVLVDLQVDGAVEAVRDVGDRAGSARVVAFGPHVMEGTLSAAEAAGADAVLTRGQLVRELARLVRSTEG
jgi:DNA-binding NarL/FixJ family response regulator